MLTPPESVFSSAIHWWEVSCGTTHSILGITYVQPGDGRGRGGAMGDEESCGEERPAPGRDRGADQSGWVNWSRPLARRVTIGVAGPCWGQHFLLQLKTPPAPTLQFKDHWLLSHQLLAYSSFYQSFSLLGRKNKDVQWSFPVFHIKKKKHICELKTHICHQNNINASRGVWLQQERRLLWSGTHDGQHSEHALVWERRGLLVSGHSCWGESPQTGIVLLLLSSEFWVGKAIYRWKTLNVQVGEVCSEEKNLPSRLWLKNVWNVIVLN